MCFKRFQPDPALFRTPGGAGSRPPAPPQGASSSRAPGNIQKPGERPPQASAPAPQVPRPAPSSARSDPRPPNPSNLRGGTPAAVGSLQPRAINPDNASTKKAVPPTLREGWVEEDDPGECRGQGEGGYRDPSLNETTVVTIDPPEEDKGPQLRDFFEIPDSDAGPAQGFSLFQACVQHTAAPNAPGWVKARLEEQEKRKKVGKPIYPLNNPKETGQLFYPVYVQGQLGKMLYDTGASHCFLDANWARQIGLTIRRVSGKATLHHFGGAAENAVKGVCHVDRLVLAGRRYAWKFLAISPAPAPVVLGLSFILVHQPKIDLRSFALWATEPCVSPHLLAAETIGEEVGEGGSPSEDLTPVFTPLTTPLTAQAITINSVLFNYQHAPFAQDDSLHLFSVTAATTQEEAALQQAYQEMSPGLRTLTEKYHSVFDPPDKEPPPRSTKHHIRLLAGAAPVKRRPYPLPPKKLEAMRDQIKELAQHGWIEPSVSPWGAPILFVPKKSGELRLCVDFRDLNAVTEDDSFPLPRIEVMLHRAASATIFSKLDLASGFHQIEVDGESRPLTAFRLPEAVEGSSLWQWKVMPFGLRNAPPTFQRAMSITLAGLDHCAIVYIDDILVYSNSEKEHLQHLEAVFSALTTERYHMRLNKCEFMKTEVEFLGHRLTPEGIQTQLEKVEAVKKWPVPFTTAKQAKSFLGVAVWYRVFIPHFSTLAAPLYDLTSTRKKFVWTEECARSVEALKQALSEAPVLARWERDLPTRIVTDASKVGLGAALEQRHGELWRPVAFWSRKLKDAETRYSATDLEWLAVVQPVTRVWHWMLEGQHFAILSDHKALETKLHKSCHDPPLNDRQSRWIESLTPFSYTFQWIQGQKNTVADALSRYPVQCNTVTVVHSLLAGLEHRIRLLAGTDQEYQRARRLAEAGSSSWKIWHGLVVDEKERVLVPGDPEVRTLLISEVHDAPMAGHFGMDKTLELLQRYWVWKDMRKDVREYVRSCISCQRIKHSTRKPPGNLHPIIARRPWQIVTMDFVGGLPPLSQSTSTQILVVVDKFSKYTILEPCPSNMTALDTAQAFIRRVVSSFGVPNVVISDRGPSSPLRSGRLSCRGWGRKQR